MASAPPPQTGGETQSRQVSAQDRQRAVQCFQRAGDAAKKGNYDYAAELFLQCCQYDPGNVGFRQALRAAQRKRYNDNKKGGKLAGARTMTPRMQIKTARARKDYHKQIDHCEEVLAINPWDVSALVDEAEACDKLGYTPVAVWLLETAQELDADNVNVLRPLALACEKHGEFEKAIDCWEKIRKRNPADDEADRRMKGLAASQAISAGGYGTETSVAGVAARAKAAAGEQTGSAAERQQERVKVLEEKFESDPSDVEAVLELVGIYRREGKLNEASEVLQTALQASGGEERVRTELSDVQLAILRNNLAIAERRYREKPDDPQTKQTYYQLAKALNDAELDEYRKRVERYPNDSGLKYELGVRFYKAGVYDQAIVQFQKARHDARRKAESLVMMGRAFEQLGNIKLAERSYEEALGELPAHDEEKMKEVRYRLGRLAEAQKQIEKAEQHYQEIAAIDFGYRDVAQRLSQLQAKNG